MLNPEQSLGDPPKVNIPGDNLVFSTTTYGDVNLYQGSGPGISQAFTLLLDRVAIGALYNSDEESDSPVCCRSARVAIMDDFYHWATSERTIRIRWIYGTEGSGKSTLVRALAKMLRKQHDLLLASFFFSRTADRRNDTTYFIPTIAYQIARSIPATRPYIERAIALDPLIFCHSLESQARALIVYPITQAYQNSGIGKKYPHVIIVDGLNECEKEQRQQRVLQVLGEILKRVPITLAFLIASRPEPHILFSFDYELSKSSTRLELKNPYETDKEVRNDEDNENARKDEADEDIQHDGADKDIRTDEDLCEKCKYLHGQLPKPRPPCSGIAAPTGKAPSEPTEPAGLVLPCRPNSRSEGSLQWNQPKQVPGVAAKIKHAENVTHTKNVEGAEDVEHTENVEDAGGAKSPTWYPRDSESIQDPLRSPPGDVACPTPPGMRSEIVKNPSRLHFEDIVIAFMGPTGSGKSNLIDVLTGRSATRAGSHLHSCTQNIEAVRMRNHSVFGDRIVFVDTPGFDDTRRSDIEILEMISRWLKGTYQDKLKLAGVVYLHRIVDNRMSGTPHQNLLMMGQLCGDRAAKKVMLVTTMWDRLGTKDVGNMREAQLIDESWRVMLSQGAKASRFDNTSRSAWGFVDAMLEQEKQREVLLIQEELVDLKRRLNETSAGRTLQSSLQGIVEDQRKRLRSLREEARASGRRDLEDQYWQLESHYKATLEQLSELRIPMSRRLMNFFGKKPLANSMTF